MFSYAPLKKMLIDRDIKISSLREELHMSPTTITKISQNKIISLTIIHKLCEHFNCKIEDIIEYVPTKENKQEDRY